jgi:hypothetical protein
MNDKKLYFSLEGVDINDDEALAAFAQQVWEQANAAFNKEPNAEHQSADKQHTSDSGSLGETDE